jgi:hypothetical protein
MSLAAGPSPDHKPMDRPLDGWRGNPNGTYRALRESRN